MITKLSVYKSRVDVPTCSISLTEIRNNRGPKMDLCDTPQEMFPKPESLFSIFKRKVLSERYDLNHFIVLFENLITLTFCNKTSWSIVSNVFCRSINIIPVNKPSLNSFKTLSVKKDNYTLHKKWSFPLRISSVNVTKSAVSRGFGHIFWRNL